MLVLLQLIKSLQNRPNELEVFKFWCENIAQDNFNEFIQEIEYNFLSEPLRLHQRQTLKRVIDNGNYKSAFKIGV